LAPVFESKKGFCSDQRGMVPIASFARERFQTTIRSCMWAAIQIVAARDGYFV